MLIYWLLLVFVIGTVIGSFLNVCIARLPFEKSILWPGSRCGRCFQPIRWYDNIPLISYLWLRGKCRSCGARYSLRYFIVELLTGLGFVGLFFLEVVWNIHDWPPCGATPWELQLGLYPMEWVVGFGFHALLFSLLLVASACDLDGREIPFGLTLTGAIIGLVGAILFPWPWPSTPTEGLAPLAAAQGGVNAPWWTQIGIGPREGLYPWPVWGPIPDWLPAGTWRMGLATGLAGLLVGTLFVRMVAYVFTKGLGKEALGLGDADLMMMAGAFLGWQPVLVAFFVSVFPALFFGLAQLIVYRDNTLPFGPSLAVGVLITMLCWKWIAPSVQILFFCDWLLVCLLVLMAGFMFLSSFLMRLLRPPGPKAKV